MQEDFFQQKLTRKHFLRRAAMTTGGLALTAGGLGALAACGGGDDASGGDTAGGDAGATGATAATTSGGGTSSGGVFKLGATPPLTGFAAADGQEQKRAQQLAVDEWNEKGGVLGMKIEPTFLDLGEMEASSMISILRQLVDKFEVDAIITGYNTFTGGAEYDAMAQAGIPYLHVHTLESAASIIREDPEKYWNIWQYDPSDKWYGLGFPVFVNAVVDSGAFEPRSKSISIIYNADPYDTTISENCRTAMTDIGWEVSLFEKVTGPLNEWGPVLQKVRSDDPDIIFLADVILGDQVSFIQQFAQNPTKSIVYGQYIPSLAEYKEQAGEAAEGAIWSTVIGLLPGSKGDEFKAKYEEKYDVAPGGSIGAILYDGTNMYLSAVEAAGTKDDYQTILDTMVEMKYEGLCGTYSFDTSDHTTFIYPEQVDTATDGIPHLYEQVQSSKDEIVVPEPVTTSQFQLPPWF